VRAGGVRPDRNPMIGIFTAQLDDAYQIGVWRGVESRARERGVGLVCFVGHRIDSPVNSEAAANVAYRIANSRNVDGLIVISSAIATFLDMKGIEQLFASRRDIPQVSVGLKVPGITSVTVDGSESVEALVGHLVRDHGLRRFALIGGPPGHPEAKDRERAFRQTLQEENVPFDDRLAVPGDFVRGSGAEAARGLLALDIPFDTLVCMNDRMALGALDVLREREIKVPAEVAVVGFDGIEESRYTTPPLTTVVQPLHELGCSAVDALLQLMNGEKPRDRTLICTPAIRQSCGCPPKRPHEADLTELLPQATAEERKAIQELVVHARSSDTSAFIVRLNAALAATALAGGRPGIWNDYLSVVRREVHTGKEAGNGNELSLFEFARVLVGETESRLQAARRVAAEERLATLRSISASLAGAFQMPVMLGRLEAGLGRLGIDGGYIALFDGRGPTGEWSRLVMMPQNGDGQTLPPGGIRFHTSRLLPPKIEESWRQGHWVLEPLVFQDEPLGYILLPGGVEEPAVYDTLRDQVASALKGALLLEQVRTHERRLEAEVARRTAELSRTNDELTREIERRMRLEREVLEISNRTMQKIGQDLHDDLCQHLAGIAMLASVLRGGLYGSDPAATASLEQIGNLLSDSIARAKQIARGLYPTGLAEHGLAAAVEELVEAARRNYPATIDFRASPDFHLPDNDCALQVYRIVQEALANALKHSGSDRVEVRLYQEDPPARGRTGAVQSLVAEVTDYGIGLPQSTPAEGMGLRIMRYRAETAGAKLRIERLDSGTRVLCRIAVGQGGS
jgi:DNA-binding LacI/PurR family transcriptional regulator/signal transduction histidine kinase